MLHFRWLAGIGAFAFAASTVPASAQTPMQSVFIEGLGGVVAPTFDIADVAKTGGAFGITVGLRSTPQWLLMGEFDYGVHDAKTGSGEIKTLHYIAKVGYSLTGPVSQGWETVLNLGAGAVTFDVDGAPENFTYFAINAGAKISYHFNPQIAFVLSPQGDIAFSEESEVGTDNAWVWPITAGLRLSF